MAWTLVFGEVGAGDVALVGGKAANLGEMTRAGLPVPAGFCVTAAAYRAFISESGTWQRIEALLGGMADDPAAVDGVATAIRVLLMEQPMPVEVSDEISARYGDLARAEAEAHPAVAVRSSATAEDLPDASFAGQQDTYLNVRGDAPLLDHVKQCWASLWTARAVAYRAKQGYDHTEVALAIAVQRMIGADVAGVLFTADPVTSARDSLVINASWGLGEAIVSGLVTPDTWTIDKASGEITSRRIGHKERQVLRSADGGTDERDVPLEQRDLPSLTDDQLDELAGFGRVIEEHYGQPMDVEWAYAGDRCFILQARPITTLAAVSSEPAEPGDFNRTMFLEIFPDPLSPAFMSVVEPLFGGMLDFTFRTLGFRPPAGLPPVGAFYSQPYLNQRYIEGALAPLKAKTRRAFVAQIVNPFGRHQRGAPVELSLPFARMGWRLLRLMRSLHELLPREVERYQAAISELDGLDLKDLDERELVARVDRLVFGAANRLLNYDFLLIALVGVTYQALGSLLEPYFGEESEEIRARLVSGVTGNVTMETNKRLWDLSRAALGSDVVSAALRRGTGDDVRSRLADSEEGRSFVAELDAFLAEYGHREIRMDILYPTWVEDPAPVFSFIRGYLDVAEDASPHRQQERLVGEREALATTVRTRVRRDRRGRLLVWPIFRWVLHHTQANTRQRDTMHFELTRLFPPFRRLLLELGDRFAAREVVADQADVFYLTLDEMHEAAGSTIDFKSRVEDRRRELEANRGRQPPPVVRDGQELWDESGTAEPGVAGELRGIAGSPGRVSGVVRIVRGPDEFDKLAEGEILVAPLTNPVWTPLFAIAGGLVTEVGGILSHGAIVAREYGIPAVMAVSGAIATLRDGQHVTVDGSRGTVTFTVTEPAPEPGA